MPAKTPYGRSLHIGVNELDETQYANYKGKLKGAENDALFMAEIANARGFGPVRLLVGPQATAQAVLDEVLEAANELPEDSFFLLTFAGHGIQTRNEDRSDDDPENFDQNWCLYDRPLLDDELRRRCWPKFAARTRVLAVIDACHSGTSAQPKNLNLFQKVVRVVRDCSITRDLPEAVVALTYLRNGKKYRAILDALPPATPIDAFVLSLAACQDQERAGDGPHGTFTAAIKEVWNDGKFAGTHRELMKAVKTIVTKRRPSQTPATCCGAVPAILNAKAFTI
jgi:hypothetical protein